MNKYTIKITYAVFNDFICRYGYEILLEAINGLKDDDLGIWVVEIEDFGSFLV